MNPCHHCYLHYNVLIHPYPYLSRLFNSLDVNRKAFGIICLDDGGKSVLSTKIPDRFPFVHPLEY